MNKQEIIDEFDDLCGTLSITHDSVGAELIKKYFDMYSSILLYKYIKHVTLITGLDFVDEQTVDFENEEWELLKIISKKIKK